MKIEDGLAEGFVFGMQERQGFGFVLRSETDLLAGGGVLGIENARSPEHDKPLFHNSVAES
jgi:hypothetical protein